MKLDLRMTPLPLMRPPRTDPTGAQAGENASTPSFDQLFERHWTAICRLLQRMLGDPAEAEDLALEAFYRLHQKGPQLDPDGNVGGWLYRVATNLGLHAIRSHRRRASYEMAAGKAALDETQDGNPLEILAAREKHALARLALAQMNSRQSELLVLRYSGMTYKDIAAALNLAPASIGPLLLRAEREFEKRYRTLAKEES